MTRSCLSGRLPGIATCITALVLLSATGCGGAEQSTTATDRDQGGTGEGTVTVASPGQGADIVVLSDGVPKGGFTDAQRSQLEQRGLSSEAVDRLETKAGKLEDEKIHRSSSPPSGHHDSTTGAAAFATKGGDNSIQQFGSEASPSELDQAAGALHRYLDARAAGSWADACSYLAPGVLASLRRLATGAGGGEQVSCSQLLASLSADVPAAALRDAAIAEVGSLRIEAGRAFLLFHGAGGVDYFIPMTHLGAEWKVAAIAASALQ